MKEPRKVCTKCLESKPVSCFSKKSKSKDGLAYYCKSCVADQQKSPDGKAGQAARAKRYLSKADVKSANAEYAKNRRKNPEIRARQNEYQAAYWSVPENRKRKSILSSKYREKRNSNPVSAAARIAVMAAWHRRNPDARSLYESRRRARKANSSGTHSADDVRVIFELQRGKCACCHVGIEDSYHVDHIIPLALGGSNGKENIQLLCPTCNMKKYKKHPVDFMQSMVMLL